MPSSLAILHELLNRNLLHSSDELATFDAAKPADLDRLVRAVRPWMMQMTQAVVGAELGEVTMKSVSVASDELDVKGGPRIGLVPAIYEQDAFFLELIMAFAELEPGSPGAASGFAHARLVTERLAAAALTAHARLSDRRLRPLAVAPSASQEEDLMALEAGVAAVLQLMPGGALILLPAHLQCARVAVQRIFRQIRQADVDLSAVPALPRRAAESAITCAREGLYFLATAALRQRHQAQRVSLKAERCPQIFTLLRDHMAFDHSAAEGVMKKLRLGTANPKKDGAWIGGPSPNHENVLSLRGFIRFYIELAREWQARGLLCGQLLGITIKTEKQRDEVVQALVREELLNEESARQLVYAARAYNPTQNFCPTVLAASSRQQQSQ